MHMIFTEEELKWINTKKFGWPIKADCPESIKRDIEKKKKKLIHQFENINDRKVNA